MRRVLTAATAAAAVFLAGAGAADATKPDRVLATPSNVCSAFVHYGVSDSFGGCMGGLHAELRAFRYPSDTPPYALLSLSQRCAELEGQGITYPFTFEEEPGWPLPIYTAQNRRQCERTLYAYHTLAEAVFGGGAA